MDYGMDDQNKEMPFRRLASPALSGISYLLGYKSGWPFLCALLV